MLKALLKLWDKHPGWLVILWLLLFIVIDIIIRHMQGNQTGAVLQ